MAKEVELLRRKVEFLERENRYLKEGKGKQERKSAEREDASEEARLRMREQERLIT